MVLSQAGSDTKKPLNLNGSPLIAGAGVSTVFGFISSFFGIGGGFLYVPALVYLLRFPIHIATATSLFVLTITAFTGSVTHVAAGLFQHGFRRVIALSIGAIIGAQLAARFSPAHSRRMDHPQPCRRIGTGRTAARRGGV